MTLGGLALGIIAIFVPPLPVLWRTGCHANFFINILLMFLGWLPAVLHAWFVILEYPNMRQRAAARRDDKEWRRASRSLDGPARSISSRGSRYDYEEDHRMHRLPPAREATYDNSQAYYRDALPLPKYHERLALPPPEQPYHNYDHNYDNRSEYVGRSSNRY